MSKKTIIIVASIAVVVIAALVASLSLSFAPKSAQKEFQASQTYSMIDKATAIGVEHSNSIIVAPATAAWWKKLLPYTTEKDINALDFSTFSKNATYLVVTNSLGSSYQVQNRLGLETTFVIYATANDARMAGQVLPKTTSHFVQGNMLLLLPVGAYSDTDYSLNKIINSKIKISASDITLNQQAVWQIDFKSFNDVYTKGASANDIIVYKKTMAMLGITEDTQWFGHSKDGLNWTGQFINKNKPTISTPKQIIAYLDNQIAFLKTDGSYAYGNAANVPENQQTGIIKPHQSIATNYMIVSNNTETAGGIINNATAKIVGGKILPKADGILKVDVQPNEWLSFMLSENASSPYTNFTRASFTLKDTNGNSTINLSVIK